MVIQNHVSILILSVLKSLIKNKVSLRSRARVTMKSASVAGALHLFSNNSVYWLFTETNFTLLDDQ